MSLMCLGLLRSDFTRRSVSRGLKGHGAGFACIVRRGCSCGGGSERETQCLIVEVQDEGAV